MEDITNEERQQKIFKNEERLQKIFTNVNDWLKFAETKSSILLAFNGASIFGLIKIFDFDLIKEHEWTQWYIYCALVQLVFSAIWCLISLTPRVTILTGALTPAAVDSNILFFEYLKSKTEVEILNELYEIDNIDFTNYEVALANQIMQNSIIASRKYSYFTVAVWLSISAYMSFLLAGLFWAYTYKEDWFYRKKGIKQ